MWFKRKSPEPRQFEIWTTPDKCASAQPVQIGIATLDEARETTMSMGGFELFDIILPDGRWYIPTAQESYDSLPQRAKDKLQALRLRQNALQALQEALDGLAEDGQRVDGAPIHETVEVNGKQLWAVINGLRVLLAEPAQ